MGLNRKSYSDIAGLLGSCFFAKKWKKKSKTGITRAGPQMGRPLRLIGHVFFAYKWAESGSGSESVKD